VGQFENKASWLGVASLPTSGILGRMTDKTSPGGWVVQVTIPKKPAVRSEDGPWRPPIMVAGAPSFQYFNVAIAAPDKAIEATAKHLANSPEAETWEISVVRKLSPAEIAALSLGAGEVKPA